MTRESQVPPKIPSRLPLLEREERILFPSAFGSFRVPLGEAREFLEAVRSSSDCAALSFISRGPRRGAAAVGVAAQVLRAGTGPEGDITLLVQGIRRIRMTPQRRRGAVRWALVSPVPEEAGDTSEVARSALRRSLEDRLDQLSGAARGLSTQERDLLRGVEGDGRYADLLASMLDLAWERAREILEEAAPEPRLRLLLEHLQKELEIQTIQESLDRQTRDEMDKRQRDYYLRQQLESIQAQLGEGEADSGAASYRKRIEELPLTPEAAVVLQKEVARLSRLGPFSEEQGQLRAYLDLALDLPWGRTTEDRLDIAKAQKDLERDHYGLKKVKERILEHLAVTALQGGRKGMLFCLVGPPGVGKTSLGKAVARALGRKFVRMSLGGVRDEAEIRGHRRTYIGAMPGRIIQGIRNAGSANPVFLLDEVDKMSADWRGDPSAALLEALDGEQNREFLDHYLGFPFDLSRVVFIVTANTVEGLHPALVDRMEILDLPGYTEQEKVAITRRHILPREIVAHGLKAEWLDIGDDALVALIRKHTREAGVRNLERALKSILRKLARRVAGGHQGPFCVTPGNLSRFLGHPLFFQEERLKADRVGVAVGLAWTELGGEVLFVEATATAGHGGLTLTGQMGEVMRESAQAALSYLKEHMKEWHLSASTFSKRDIHIHIPEGAIPKDGPSAGATMAVAVLSTLTGRPVRRDSAFSGEITLRGDLLPVGGLREKLLAAQRAGIRRVLLPAANRPEKTDIPRSVLKDLEILWVRTMDEVFPHALA